MCIRDRSKLKPGQTVRIGVDAFPEKSYTGLINEVANIGEQLPNTDAKVFEVIIKLNETDPILRPSMTTSNQIITSMYEDVLYIPLEAVHATDSFSYVFIKNGFKQIVVLGESNENEIIVEMGLEEGAKVLLSIPEDPEKFALRGEEFLEIIAQREEQKRLEEEAIQQEAAKRAAEREERMRILRQNPQGQFRTERDSGTQPTIQRSRQPGSDQVQSRQQEERQEPAENGTNKPGNDGKTEEKPQEEKK